MPSRILRESITTSDSIDMLSLGAERFFYRLLTVVDDFGRQDGRPSVLRAKCFPLKLASITDKSVASWLGELADAGIVQVYVGPKGGQYMAFINWERYWNRGRRADRSKFPDPDISSDIRGIPDISSDIRTDPPGRGGMEVGSGDDGKEASARRAGAREETASALAEGWDWEDGLPGSAEGTVPQTRGLSGQAAVGPQSADRSSVVPSAEPRPDRDGDFARFRSEYPPHRDGTAWNWVKAGTAWNRHVAPGRGPDVFRGLEAYRKSERVREGFVLSPENWLENWESYLPTTAAPATKVQEVRGPNGELLETRIVEIGTGKILSTEVAA